MNVMRPAAVGRHADGLGLSREKRQATGLDERVEHEGAARLPLAVAAVAAMDEHRRRFEPIPNRAAGAAAFETSGHSVVLRSA